MVTVESVQGERRRRIQWSELLAGLGLERGGWLAGQTAQTETE